MSTKAAEKIIEALAQLVEGFAELQDQIEGDFHVENEDTEDELDEDSTEELQEALLTEIRASVEAVIENEDCAPEDIATVVSALTDALEEIAPEVFVQVDQDDDQDSYYQDDEDDDDIDLDDDDDDYEYDDDDDDDDDD